jgi:hypothetical protein
MKRDFEVISRDMDVRGATIGAMFAGILTDRDIAIRLAAEDTTPRACSLAKS